MDIITNPYSILGADLVYSVSKRDPLGPFD